MITVVFPLSAGGTTIFLDWLRVQIVSISFLVNQMCLYDPLSEGLGHPYLTNYHRSKYATKVLHIGHTDSNIKHSSHFVEKIFYMGMERGDLLVSFDVVALFTKVSVKYTLDSVRCIFFLADIIFQALLHKRLLSIVSMGWPLLWATGRRRRSNEQSSQPGSRKLYYGKVFKNRL